MIVAPCELREACAFITAHHRHHRPPQGHRWSLKVVDAQGTTHAVAVVGRPVGRHQQDGQTVEVTRLCSDGAPNACSMLLGAVRRAARAMGYRRVITYILESEHGASLRAAGYERTELTDGGAWSGTYGSDRGPDLFGADGAKRRSNAHPTCRKWRYEAATS